MQEHDERREAAARPWRRAALCQAAIGLTLLSQFYFFAVAATWLGQTSAVRSVLRRARSFIVRG